MNRISRYLTTVVTLLTFVGVLATGCGQSTETPASGVSPAAAESASPAQGEAPASAESHASQPSGETGRSAEVNGDRASSSAPPATRSRSQSETTGPATTRPSTGTPASHDSVAVSAKNQAIPQPPPAPVVKTIPAGTIFEAIVENGASSQTSQPGQPVRARLANDLSMDGNVVVPSGSVFEGTVTEAVPQKKIGGIAKLSLAFATLRLPSGQVVPVSAAFTQEGKSQTKKDAATIGGSAAGGALLGKILGGSTKDAAIGAVVGAAAGTAVAAKNKGDAVELASGEQIALTLAYPAEITLR